MVPVLDNPIWDHHLACTTKGMVLLQAKECLLMDLMVTLMVLVLASDPMEDHHMALVPMVLGQVDNILAILPKVDLLQDSIPVLLDGMDPMHHLAKVDHHLVNLELPHLDILV